MSGEISRAACGVARLLLLLAACATCGVALAACGVARLLLLLAACGVALAALAACGVARLLVTWDSDMSKKDLDA